MSAFGSASNVLTFGDWAPLAGSGSAKVSFRQVHIDGVPLPYLLPEGSNTVNAPLPDPPVDAAAQLTYLRSLLGDPPADDLQPGRVGLQFCSSCFDSSCGILLAADLDIGTQKVSWRYLGFETEHAWKTERKKVWGPIHRSVVVGPPDELWTPNPFDPALHFYFERGAYESAVNSEIDRLQRGSEA